MVINQHLLEYNLLNLQKPCLLWLKCLWRVCMVDIFAWIYQWKVLPVYLIDRTFSSRTNQRQPQIKERLKQQVISEGGNLKYVGFYGQKLLEIKSNISTVQDPWLWHPGRWTIYEKNMLIIKQNKTRCLSQWHCPKSFQKRKLLELGLEFEPAFSQAPAHIKCRLPGTLTNSTSLIWEMGKVQGSTSKHSCESHVTPGPVPGTEWVLWWPSLCSLSHIAGSGYRMWNLCLWSTAY